MAARRRRASTALNVPRPYERGGTSRDSPPHSGCLRGLVAPKLRSSEGGGRSHQRSDHELYVRVAAAAGVPSRAGEAVLCVIPRDRTLAARALRQDQLRVWRDMPKIRLQTLLALFVLGVGLVVAFVVGLFAWVSLTAPTLHPDAEKVKSVAHSAPARKWIGAVEQGRQVVRVALKEQNLPGLSVAVGIDGEIVWAEGFGWADLEHQQPVGPDIKFRIGTASKALTSAAVGLLLEKNRLKLDDELQTYVPEFPKKLWPVTLRQLMAHQAGLRNDGGDEGPFYSKQCERPIEALPTFAGHELLFEPGTRYRYSNYGWILVSAAVEAAANERVLTFMRTQDRKSVV